MKNKRITKQNKIVKATLAILVAGTAFSATKVLAEEPVAPIEVDLHIEDSTKSNELAEIPNDPVLESPSLLPGDFFYFTKVLLEKITLALTFDDSKEARLIAEYAAERLSEAEVLFAEGDEEAALETMTAAIEYMENTDDVVEEPLTEEPVEEQTEVIDVELEVEVIANDDASSKEEPEGEVEDGIEALGLQNIIALTAAIEKVKNPKAKAALQKNINKSYTKLAKKLEKQIKKEEKQGKKEEVITRKESDSIELIQVVEQETGTKIKNDEVKISPVSPSKHEQREAAKLEKNKIQKESKQQRHEAKAEMMEEKKHHKEKKKKDKGNKGNKGKVM